MIPEGWFWNEAEIGEDRRLLEGLVSLIVIKPDGSLTLIGTAFLITGEKSHACAVTAAHCFDFIDREINPNLLHHSTALPEFLPPPKETELTTVKALLEKDSIAYVCDIDVAFWDRQTDLAILKLRAPLGASSLFETFFMLTDKIPEIGDQVAMVGFGEMKANQISESHGIMQRRLVLRLGRVEEIYPHGHYMLTAHCIKTTIPIYFGMSGGLIAKFGELGSKIMPFGVISNAPEPQPLNNRAQSGHSIATIISSKITSLADEIQRLEIPFTVAGIGRMRAKPDF